MDGLVRKWTRLPVDKNRERQKIEVLYKNRPIFQLIPRYEGRIRRA